MFGLEKTVGDAANNAALNAVDRVFGFVMEYAGFVKDYAVQAGIFVLVAMLLLLLAYRFIAWVLGHPGLIG